MMGVDSVTKRFRTSSRRDIARLWEQGRAASAPISGGPALPARALEFAVCVVCLIVLAPFFAGLALALAVLGQSPFFVQERVGKDEIPFRILKFRTLPDGGWPPVRDGRWTWRLRCFRQLSRRLRATGIDEFPQLINVLRGEMGLIGPRPLTPEDYRLLPSDRWRRSVVPPGITGLAQVNGGQALDAVSKLELDLRFVDAGDWCMHAQIVCWTLARLCGLLAVEQRAANGPQVRLPLVDLGSSG